MFCTLAWSKAPSPACVCVCAHVCAKWNVFMGMLPFGCSFWTLSSSSTILNVWVCNCAPGVPHVNTSITLKQLKAAASIYPRPIFNVANTCTAISCTHFRSLFWIKKELRAKAEPNQLSLAFLRCYREIKKKRQRKPSLVRIKSHFYQCWFS